MRIRRQMFSSLFAVLLVCSTVLWLSGAPPTWAQSTSTGTLAGTVTDQSGALVNGATVTIIDTSTKTSHSVTTNEAGRYIVVDVAPGAERPAGAGEDDGTDLRVVAHLVQRVGQRVVQFPVEGVEGLRPVHGEDPDRSVLFDKHGVTHGRPLPP